VEAVEDPGAAGVVAEKGRESAESVLGLDPDWVAP